MKNTYSVEKAPSYETAYNNLKRDLSLGHIKKIQEADRLLKKEGTLPKGFKLHKLKGKFKSLWEFHIDRDLIIAFERDKENKVITWIDIGHHQDVLRHT